MPPQENTPVSTPSPVVAPSKNTTMAVLSYIGILVLIPLFTSKDDPFVKFHIKQGLVLLCIEVICQLLTHTMYALYSFGFIFAIINVTTLILSIIGIMNAVKGQEKELPIVGSFAKNFKF